jgi:ParB-like chromosome segregation protein Spo0J
MATRSKQQTDRFFDHLFSTKESVEVGNSDINAEFFLLDRDKIEVESQPRTLFAPDSLKELAESIRELNGQGRGIGGTGILQPLLVRPVQAPKGALTYVLVAGVSTLAEQLVENLQRQDLSVFEEAQGIKRLIDVQKISAREAGRILGKDRGWINNRLALLRAGEDVLSLVENGSATLSHALLIESIKEPQLRLDLLEATRSGEPIATLRSIIESFEQGDPKQGSDVVALHNATASSVESAGYRFDFSSADKALRKLAQEIKQNEKTDEECENIRSQISKLRNLLKKIESSL